MIKTNYCKKIRGVAEMRGQLGEENWVPCFHPEPCGSEKINMNFSAESRLTITAQSYAIIISVFEDHSVPLKGISNHLFKLNNFNISVISGLREKKIV